jgi:hypothetical protein
MMCPNREGAGICPWWINECKNPCVLAEIKKGCNGQLPRYKTLEFRRKLYSYTRQSNTL